MKNILFVASEAVPFIKTGGLADVAGSLPKAFNKQEFDVRVILPKYRIIPDKYKNQMQYKTHFYMDIGWQNQYVGVLEMQLDGVTFYFIDNEHYFSGDQAYEGGLSGIWKSSHISARQRFPACRSSVSIRISSTAMTGRPGSCLYI